MRFADIFGKGLIGTLTGIDLTNMVRRGGLVGEATGMKTPGFYFFFFFFFFFLSPLSKKKEFFTFQEKRKTFLPTGP